MTSTNTNTDLRALAARPAPVAKLDNPWENVTANDPVRKAAQDVVLTDGRRYAALEAGKAAELLARVFPGAHRAWFSFEYDPVDTELVATLRAVWHADGAMLWHSIGQIGEHPDAVARAREEAYGGPVMPTLDTDTSDMIESLVKLAENLGRGYFPIPEGAWVTVLGDGKVEHPQWCWRDRTAWLRELVVPEAIAKAQQLRDADQPVQDRDLFVLTITYKHGTLVSYGRSEAAAKRGLALFAREYWPEVAGRHGCPDEPPADDDEVVRLYFEARPDEGWSIDTADALDEPEKPADAAVERLTQIAEQHSVSWLGLSEVVHDLFASQASDVNNGGIGEMVRCLVEQLDEAGAEEHLRDLIGGHFTGRRYTDHNDPAGKACRWSGLPAPDDTDEDSRCPAGCAESSTEEACITCGEARGGDGWDGECGNCADRTENAADEVEDNGARYYVTSINGSETFAGPFEDQGAANEAAEKFERDNPGAATDIRYEIR